MSSGSGGGLNIFGRYLGGGGNKRNAGANANGNGAPGGSSSNREPHNLPKILRATVDTGREVNVIEAKAARSQPKKVVSMISSPVVTRSHSPARPPIHSSSSAVTPTGSPLLQKRMQFKINVTPSGKGSSSTPLNSKSLRSTTCECDVNGNRLNFVNNKTTTTGATGGDLRCSIDVVKENNLARLFGSKSSSSSKQTSNSNTFTRSRTNKADSGGLSNFAVNFNVALNMERSDAHEEIDLPRGAAHKEAAESKGGDEQGTAAAAAAASASLEDIYSDPMTADTSIEQARNSSGDGGQRLSLSLDTASSLKVAVRLRPFSAAEAALSSGKALDVLIKDDQVLLPHRKEYFKFDHCLNSSDQELFNYADQETVYRKMGEPLLEYAFRGYNTCLFAYGQSGSGKTYTMMGSEVVPGIIPRFLNDLFKRISSPRASYLPSGTTTTTTTEYIVNVSFMEIYNEKIHDLLADQFEAIRKGPLKVREHPETGPFVEDLTVYTVESYENAMELLASGNERRTTASTAANEQSSRSHTIFTVILVQNKTVTNGGGGGGGGDEPGWGQPQQEQPEESTTSTTISKVHLVDLAGSERASAVSAAKDRQREGTFINKSLLTLGKVISQLAEAAKTGPSSSSSLKAAGGEAAEQQTNGNSAHPHIPYRDSTLTFLLKDSLGGNSRTSMIATISPAKEHLEETVSTLRYASTASKIVNVVHVNEDPKIQIINSLLKQISFLKREVESATAAAAAVKSSEEQQQQQPKQFETTAAPPPAVVPPPPPPTSSTEPKEKEEEIAVSVDVNLDESKDVEDGSTAEFASAPTSPPSFAPPASPSPATAATAALPEDYCSGACTKRITVKLEQLDGKFNQLLQNQRSFEEKLAGFVETVAASSPPPPSTGSKTLEALPPSLAMSSKVVDELKSLLAKVKSESAGIGKDKDKDFEALLKSMESPAAAVDDDYLEDDDHHLLATVETSRKEEAASKDSPPAVATAAISAWTSKGNHIHNNISNKDKPMITKPMNEKEKKAAEAAQKAADAAQRRQEEKEAREAKQKKEEEEAAKRKEEAEKKEAEAKKEAREKAEQEKAEKVAKQKEEKEAREAKRKEEEAAEAKKKADEKEAREKADKEKADKVAKQKAEKEAAEEKKKQEEKAEREAKQKAEKEAKEAKRKEEEAAEAKKKADKEKAEKEKAEKEAAEAKKKAQAEEEEAKKKAEEEAAAAEAEKKKAEEEEAATKAANDNDDDDDGFMPLSKKDKRKLLKAKKFEAAEEEVEEEVTPAAASTANSDDDDNDFELPPKNLKGNALKKWKKEQREKNLAKLKKATEEAKEKVEVDEEKGEEEKEEVAARPPKKLTPKEQKKLDREKKKADKKNKKGKKGGGGDSDESGDDGEEEEEEAKFTIELGKNQKKDGDDSDDEAKSGKKKAKKGKKGK